MSNVRYFNDDYSTTRMLVKEKPYILNKKEDKYESILFLPIEGDEIKEGGFRTKGYFKKSYEDIPLISIVTVVYNGERFLEETIKSVISQDYDNIEYIIVDGGSTDKTIEIIEKYESKIDYWVSEKDTGIYDAMNKGIRLSLGKIIGIINADDWYEAGAFSVVSQYANKECIITGSMTKYTVDLESSFISIRTAENLKYAFNAMPLNHPSTFVLKSVYKKIGLFNDQYQICADNEFILRALKNNINIVFVKKILANMRMGGVSENIKSIFLRTKEHYNIRKEYTYPRIKNFIIASKYFSKHLLKSIILSVQPDKIKHSYYKRKRDPLV